MGSQSSSRDLAVPLPLLEAALEVAPVDPPDGVRDAVPGVLRDAVPGVLREDAAGAAREDAAGAARETVPVPAAAGVALPDVPPRAPALAPP